MALLTAGTTAQTSLNALLWNAAINLSDLGTLNSRILDDQVAQGTDFTINGNTNTSTSITNLTSTVGIMAGMAVVGSGVPDLTTVVSVDSATAITISAATTTSVSATPLTFFTKRRVRGAFSANGLLMIPNRGMLKVLPGDYVAVDPRTGWPILVSSFAIAKGRWVHS